MMRRATESEIQEAIVDALRLCGLTVIVTSRRRWLGRSGQGGDGADRGLPDLLVTHDGWHSALWLGLEVKRPGGRLSPEQAVLLRRRRIILVTSVEDALQAVITATRPGFLPGGPFRDRLSQILGDLCKTRCSTTLRAPNLERSRNDAKLRSRRSSLESSELPAAGSGSLPRSERD